MTNILIIIIILIYIIVLYNKLSPCIDIIKKGDRYTILLWYYNLKGIKKFIKII